MRHCGLQSSWRIMCDCKIVRKCYLQKALHNIVLFRSFYAVSLTPCRSITKQQDQINKIRVKIEIWRRSWKIFAVKHNLGGVWSALKNKFVANLMQIYIYIYIHEKIYIYIYIFLEKNFDKFRAYPFAVHFHNVIRNMIRKHKIC